MDKYMILETKTESVAQKIADQIHQSRCDEWAAQGGSLILKDGKTGLVPKNALTGEDDLTAQITYIWDDVKATEDGKFYVAQKDGFKPNLWLWETYTEKEKPVEVRNDDL